MKKSWIKVVVCFSFHGAQFGQNSKSSNVGHCIETCFGRDLDFCVDNCGFWMEVMQKWNCNLTLFCNQNNKIFWYPYKQHKKVTCARSSSYFSNLKILPKFFFEPAWDHRRWGCTWKGKEGKKEEERRISRSSHNMDNNESHDENIRRNQSMEREPPWSGGLCHGDALQSSSDPGHNPSDPSDPAWQTVQQEIIQFIVHHLVFSFYIFFIYSCFLRVLCKNGCQPFQEQLELHVFFIFILFIFYLLLSF